MATRKRYSAQFRERAIALALANPKRPLRDIARELGVPQTVFNNWVRRAQARPPRERQPGTGQAKATGPETSKADAERIRQLERELETAKKELEFAKKRRPSSPRT